jgi:hypothetical protein
MNKEIGSVGSVVTIIFSTYATGTVVLPTSTPLTPMLTPSMPFTSRYDGSPQATLHFIRPDFHYSKWIFTANHNISKYGKSLKCGTYLLRCDMNFTVVPINFSCWKSKDCGIFFWFNSKKTGEK